MAIKLVLVCWLWVFGLAYDDTADLRVYRKLMEQSVEDSKVATQFYEKLKTVKDDGLPVVMGFKAMSEFLMCKHLVNPLSRLSHFKNGRKLLEEAIAKSEDNPELIFFRYTTQLNCPSILNYNGNLASDKAFLLQWLNKNASDEDLYKRIKTFMAKRR
ncbi:hypothetical protein LPB86_15460 [Pedobacter sp. MC2016-14]|uniref:hypothetical protein n=1 Tax=Pedobacter sp. MC2016-14 TaxID=2897327 RepID=UPI001E647B13|nr:hypothetical protein [Pedobacter sp. MC2016-14]MCD0489639.1 hypothetical protein [Pedobacter sp. MC2016-14]